MNSKQPTIAESIAARPPTAETTNAEVLAYVEDLYETAATPHRPWLSIVARLLRASIADPAARVTSLAIANFSLDPLVPSGDERLQRCFICPTNGSDPGLDSLAILVEVLKELEPDERAASLAYITSRFMGPTP